MAHISRLDDFWLRLQRVIQYLFFFNPIIWICNRQIENQRELICDKMVVSQGSISVTLYGKTMLDVLQLIQTKRMHTGVAGYISDHGFYRERLLELLAQKPITTTEKLRNLIITAVMLVCVLPMAPTSKQERVHRELAVQLASDMLPGVTRPEYLDPLQSFEIVHPYGLRKNKIPLFAEEEFHSGVDLGAPVGADVLSVSDGIVEIARDGPMDAISVSTGGYILIKHEDGNKSLYVHVSPIMVSKGQLVKRGQPIGKVCPVFDTSNFKANAYLHFELISNDIRINPELYLPLSPR
jgi:murein DD-endopeptidase MepM/ murein hydrolase activator NlpD